MTTNEYITARRMRKDHWLYVVFHFASTPSLISEVVNRNTAQTKNDWTLAT